MTDTEILEKQKVAIKEATVADLRHHASVYLGAEVAPNATANVLRNRILELEPDTTHVFVAPPDIAARGPQVPTAQSRAADDEDEGHVPDLPEDMHPRLRAHHRYDPKVTVNVPSFGKDTGDLQLSVNGDTITIKRGVNVEIPYRFYLALQLAVQKEPVFSEPDPVTQVRDLSMEERPSVPYTIAVFTPLVRAAAAPMVAAVSPPASTIFWRGSRWKP